MTPWQINVNNLLGIPQPVHPAVLTTFTQRGQSIQQQRFEAANRERAAKREAAYQAIIDAIREAGESSPAKLARKKSLCLSLDYVQQAVGRMVQQGRIIKVAHGVYAVP